MKRMGVETRGMRSIDRIPIRNLLHKYSKFTTQIFEIYYINIRNLLHKHEIYYTNTRDEEDGRGDAGDAVDRPPPDSQHQVLQRRHPLRSN